MVIPRTKREKVMPVIVILIVAGFISSVLGRKAAEKFASEAMELFCLIPNLHNLVDLGEISHPEGAIKVFFGNRSLAMGFDRVVVATNAEALAHEVGHYLAPHGFNMSAGPIPAEVAAWVAAQQLAAADGGKGVDALSCAAALSGYMGSSSLGALAAMLITGEFVNPMKVKSALKEIKVSEGIDKAAVKAVLAPMVEAMRMVRDGESLMPEALSVAHEAHMIAEDVRFAMDGLGMVETAKVMLEFNVEMLDAAVTGEFGKALPQLQVVLDRVQAGLKFSRLFM